MSTFLIWWSLRWDLCKSLQSLKTLECLWLTENLVRSLSLWSFFLSWSGMSMVIFSQIFKAEPSMSKLWLRHPGLDPALNAEIALQDPWGSSRLLLVFWFGAVLGIIVLLIAVIAFDLGNIPFSGTILISPLWSFFLGISSLSNVGLGSVGLRGVGLGDILLTCSEASFSLSSPSLMHLFFFLSKLLRKLLINRPAGSESWSTELQLLVFWPNCLEYWDLSSKIVFPLDTTDLGGYSLKSWPWPPPC